MIFKRKRRIKIKRRAVLLLSAWIVALVTPQQLFAERDNQNGQCCTVVEQALSELNHIKVGAKRKEIEKQFVIDGGVTFRNETTYIFKLCPLIKIKVTFSQNEGSSTHNSSNDVIRSISKPYIEYAAKD